METKKLKDLEIWDGKQFTKLNTIQRHIDEDVVTIETENGLFLTCKETHPSWAKFCPEDEEEVIVEAKHLLRMFVLTRNGYEEIVKVTSGKNKDFLYDVSTDTKAFEANYIRTHNSFHCNHADSLVFLKINERILCLPLEELFELVKTEIFVESDLEYKICPEGWKIWDTEWVDLKRVSRHIPDAPMIALGDTSLLQISQATHPVCVYKNLERCIFCNHPYLKEMSPSSKSRWKTANKKWCGSCKKYQEKILEPMGKDMKLIEANAVEIGDYLEFNVEPIFQTQKEEFPLPYDGYAVAAFLAEGCVLYDKTSGKEVPRKIEISQYHEHIRYEIAKHVEKSVPITIRRKGVYINRTEEAKKFHKIFPRYSLNKRLPSNFLSYSEEWLWDFLAGMVDTDGYITKNDNGARNYLAVCGQSFALMQQVWMICMKLGLYARISQKKHREPKIYKGKLIKHNNTLFAVDFSVTPETAKKLNSSVKVRNLTVYGPGEKQTRISGKRKLITKAPNFYTKKYVYDVTTSTGKVVVSGLRASNSGGTAMSRGGGSVSKLDRLNQLLNLPKNLPGSASLSKLTGTIHSIEKDESVGGHNVHVSSGAKISKHYVPEYNELLVKPGDSVNKGDRLSSGPINPHHLLALKNMDAVRTYLADEMGHMYKEVGGVRRRNVEVVVRNLTNNTEVVDPGASDHLAGDLANISKVEEFNRGQKNPDHKIIHKPILKGIKEAALIKDEDWLNRMNFQRIQNTLIEGAGKGWKAKTTDSISPIGPFAAATIGKHIPGKAEY